MSFSSSPPFLSEILNHVVYLQWQITNSGDLGSIFRLSHPFSDIPSFHCCLILPNKIQQAGLQAASRILMKCVPSFLFQCCFQRKTAATSSNASSNSDAASENVNESVFKFIFPSDATKIESDSAPQDSNGTFKSTTKSRFQVFTYKQLKNATNGFTLRLGRGGFGSVYYGKLEDGREVAIKSFHENKDKTIQQFLNEIKMLSSLRHPNLLSSYGCSCSHSHKLLLVYEYISNGTLSDHLYGKLAKASTVAWPVRLNIAIETASALAYLHASGIIHRDVKSSNILLDDNFSAKVADFGLSRGLPLVSRAKYATHASTAPQGTHGYMDPEYFRSHRVSDKSDVYSFGVVLCELMSSKPAAPIEMNGEYHSFAAHAASMIQDEGLEHLVDPSLRFGSDNEIRQSITVVGELAFQCLQCPKELRPSMKQVLQTLQGIKQGTWRFHQIT